MQQTNQAVVPGADQPSSYMALSLIDPGINPRKYFDPVEMAELEASVKAQGVIQPILIRPMPNGRFQLVAGERRYRAAKAVGHTEIPVFLREMTDQEAHEAASTENINRAPMSPAEEAQAAAKALGACGGDHDEAAKRLGWSRTTLDKRLALMNCSDKTLQALTERKIQLGHAELLAAVTKDKQDVVLDRLLSAPVIPNIASLKLSLEKIACPLDSAIFDKAECATCQYNSNTQQALFSETVGGSNCTNGSCYEAKTTATLNQKAEGLKDEYPVIKIVNPGENFTILKLVGEGATGVGVEQAAQCRACAKFGAAISNVPGKIGNVYRDQCFDPACNADKVAARIAADKAADAAAAKEAKKVSTGPAVKADVAAGKKSNATPKTTTTVEVSQRVKDYRVKVWRAAYQRESQRDAERNITLLLLLAVTHNLGKVGEMLLRKAFEKLSGGIVLPTMNIAEIGKIMATAQQDVRSRMVTAIAASVSETVEENTLKDLLAFMETDLRNYWKLNEEYLELLTKSEIEVVADEIGLKAAMGESFTKALSGKKSEIIKQLLAVEGFNYAAMIPKHLQYTAK